NQLLLQRLHRQIWMMTYRSRSSKAEIDKTLCFGKGFFIGCVKSRIDQLRKTIKTSMEIEYLNLYFRLFL
ncbi:hypothetical protein, partial [Acinetobacter indicus]|uniref:hypothetical protein n=1 Tax=Acinetobacter indicus TaxID=756892 RepID=UPI001C5ECAA9